MKDAYNRLKSFQRKSLCKGFTLIEMLTSVAIVATLGALSATAYKTVQDKARLTRELSSAKTLIAAYNSYANENNGRFMAGRDPGHGSVTTPDGKVVSAVIAERYPFRLAPYFDWDLSGVLFINGLKTEIENLAPHPMGVEYYQSLYPALGLNSVLLGGDLTPGNTIAGGEVVQNAAQASTNLIVFVSAASGAAAGGRSGYWTVSAPLCGANQWNGATWNSSSNPASFGHVDPRHDGKAVAAFLDGSVRQLSMTELSDMRLWSQRANETDNRDYVVQFDTPATGGGRR